LGQICDALDKVCGSTKDTEINSKAESMAENEFKFEFILAAVLCYVLLCAVWKASESSEYWCGFEHGNHASNGSEGISAKY
jgi:hypothetical protein